MDNAVNFHGIRFCCCFRKWSRTENQFVEGESPSSSALSDSVKPMAERVRETVNLGQLDNIEPTNPSSSAIHRALVTHLTNDPEQRFVQEFAQEIVKLLQPFAQKMEVDPDMPLEIGKFPSLFFRQLPFDIKSLALHIEALLKKCPKEHCQEALKEALIAVLDIDWVNENIKDAFIKILVEKGARITQNVEEHVYNYETALMVAIRYKDLKATHDLLARVNSSNVDRKDPCFNQTALTYAADYGNLEALQTLLERGADVNHQDRFGTTALMYAVGGEHLEAVHILLARGADVNQKDNEGRTVLTYAVTEYSDEMTMGQSAKCMQIIKALAEREADVNTTLTYLMAKHDALPLAGNLDHVNKQDDDGVTKLMLAAEQKDLKTVLDLLERGADVNLRDSDGKTALMWAQSKEVVQALIAKRANVNQQDHFGNTALHLAESGDIVNALIVGGADVNKRNNIDRTAFMDHVRCEHEEAVNALLAKGVDVNEKDKDGTTALMLAQSKKVVNALLAKGADVNERDKDGRTALMWAMWGRHEDVVDALVAGGANINMQDNKGRTALIWALAVLVYRNMESFFALLRKGADVNKKDEDGKTALMWAIERRNIPALHALLEKQEVDVEETDKALRLAEDISYDTKPYTEVLWAMLKTPK